MIDLADFSEDLFESISIKSVNLNKKDEDNYYNFKENEIINGYKIIKVWGKGVFSIVFKVIKQDSEYALKIIKNDKIYIDSGLKEINILKYFKSKDLYNKKGIIKFIDDFYYENNLCIIFEKLDFNLRELLNKKDFNFSLANIKFIISKLIYALYFLKCNKIIHTDSILKSKTW